MATLPGWSIPGTLLAIWVCAVIPFILDVRRVDAPAGVTQQEEGHTEFFSPFWGACINFNREKDSAIPFPRRPSSRILCAHELIVLHFLVGHDLFLFCPLLFIARLSPIGRK